MNIATPTPSGSRFDLNILTKTTVVLLRDGHWPDYCRPTSVIHLSDDLPKATDQITSNCPLWILEGTAIDVV
jgi:hypothetical protein